jgi:hypothetical protein
MGNVRLPMAVCAAVAEVLTGSHATREAIFRAVGVPGEPPDLAHNAKWKTWLRTASNDPNVDGLRIIGELIEEFMDVPPSSDAAGGSDASSNYQEQRARLVAVLEENGLRYYRGGRVLPNGTSPPGPSTSSSSPPVTAEAKKPSSIEELLQTIIRGLPRAIHPLAYRRKGAQSLSFNRESDIQDLLHSHLRPWVADVRPEEFTPSYAGSSTRMDFLLPAHKLVIETKSVRDRIHASKVGDELIIDIEHYRRHPQCDRLWCVIYDPEQLVSNPAGLTRDLDGLRSTPDGSVAVRVYILAG